MYKKQLCLYCKTGFSLLQLDKREPMCPYIHMHNGENCSFYNPMTSEIHAIKTEHSRINTIFRYTNPKARNTKEMANKI